MEHRDKWASSWASNLARAPKTGRIKLLVIGVQWAIVLLLSRASNLEASNEKNKKTTRRGKSSSSSGSSSSTKSNSNFSNNNMREQNCRLKCRMGRYKRDEERVSVSSNKGLLMAQREWTQTKTRPIRLPLSVSVFRLW